MSDWGQNGNSFQQNPEVKQRSKPLNVSPVSEQKLKTTSVSSENIPSKDDKMSGNRIFDVEILHSVLSCLCCPSCLSVNLQLTEDSIFGLSSDVAECGVSVDGTWQRRGHSSLNGCIAVLSIDTGKVLDLELISRWCRVCNTTKGSGNSKRVSKHQCLCNHQGSAGSMESVGAYRLLERSRETRKLEYRILCNNIGDLEEMQRAVITAFYHCCSGKSNPMHGQCPLGSESWCAYQRAQSAGKVLYDKHAGLPKSIIDKIKPTYLQLCDQKLLRKCLHGKTQNANEIFNGCLWNVVPKEIFVELQTFSLGSHIAVINFNKGFFTRLLSVLEALDIKIGPCTIRGYAAIDKTRIEDSKRHSLPSAKITRKKFELLNR
ncbi:CCHC-type domain-containing protein [Trichonephila clavipes]|nr:CCHC-type domain-containing protein [Trichonephila clavipes]